MGDVSLRNLPLQISLEGIKVGKDYARNIVIANLDLQQIVASNQETAADNEIVYIAVKTQARRRLR